jgi:hypothetical protein
MTARLQFTLVLVLVAAGIAVPCALHHRAQQRHRERDELVQQQAAQLAKLSAENDRLSNLVDHARTPTLPADQQRELLKLRGGIAQLRQTAKEMEQLRAANQQYSDSTPSRASTDTSTARPDPATVLAYWPKDQLAPAGYADPQSALKTFLSALSHGDWESLFVSTALPAEAHAEFEEHIKTEHGRDEANKLAQTFAPYSAFYVVGQRTPSENLAILDLFFEGDGKTRKVALQKIGQEWKFKSLGRPGQSDEDVENGGGFL